MVQTSIKSCLRSQVSYKAVIQYCYLETMTVSKSESTSKLVQEVALPAYSLEICMFSPCLCELLPHSFQNHSNTDRDKAVI